MSRAVHERADLLWRLPPPEGSLYQLESDGLIAAIRNDKPYNEARLSPTRAVGSPFHGPVS